MPQGREILVKALESYRPVGFDLPIFDVPPTRHDLGEKFALKRCSDDMQIRGPLHFLFTWCNPTLRCAVGVAKLCAHRFVFFGRMARKSTR
jgi:hypothetical protein